VTERSNDQPEQPRSEPEIIPPGYDVRGQDVRDPGGRGRGAGRHGPLGDTGPGASFERVYVFRPRPLNALFAVLALGAVAAALVVFLLGAVLIALPVVGTIVAIALVTAFLRGSGRPAR
jgi:hypothetical protein